ncbi:MAG: zinc-ribbon domain-containing protein [Flavobacteriales bacterium]|nr:zinc-ribbon domain-containing protein [Flavobacteriales bacterium]
MNKVINVTLTGGIIGYLGVAPRKRLESAIQKQNADGWRVVQVIPADSGNVFLLLLRILILVFTLFLYTPMNGYYVIMERASAASPVSAGPAAVPRCSSCGTPSQPEDAFCQNCGNKLK